MSLRFEKEECYILYITYFFKDFLKNNTVTTKMYYIMFFGTKTLKFSLCIAYFVKVRTNENIKNYLYDRAEKNILCNSKNSQSQKLYIFYI